MHSKENNKLLHEKLKEFMKPDRAKHSIIAPSKFGVVEITRQRVRPVTDIETSEVCPSCGGTGKIQASIMFTDEIESKINYLLLDRKEKKISLWVHPYLYAYFTKGGFLRSKQWKWYFKFKKWIAVNPVNQHQFLEYHFKNSNNENIEL